MGNQSFPDENGRFGDFGGRYVAETLMPPILALEKAYEEAKADPEFQNELDTFMTHYVGRPSPLYFAERLTEETGGAKIYFKRDELNHTGAHKINNCMGQLLLAKRMGKNRIIAETGAGQHGVFQKLDFGVGFSISVVIPPFSKKAAVRSNHVPSDERERGVNP